MPHLLDVENLTTVFHGDYGDTTGVDHVSFHVDTKETLCLVGESGCGNSATALSVMGLLNRAGRVTSGQVLFEGQDLLTLSEKELDAIRGNRMAMVFQDPLTSLNPVFTIGSQITESIHVHMHLSGRAAKEQAEEMLAEAGMPDPAAVMKEYPHTLSGGMRQRAMIAMALACHPALLIADEPTTALDVTIQAQIMQLLRKLQQENDMAVILITHDMGLVAQMADRVMVMYAGQFVEEAPAEALFAHPVHPYTKALLAAVPQIRDGGDKRLVPIPGMVPERYDDIPGCRFAGRCTKETDACAVAPVWTEWETGHFVRCVCLSEEQS